MDRVSEPLRTVVEILRDPEKPDNALLKLDCGHIDYVVDFPFGKPPPCFRRICAECGETYRLS